jgi:hypothetical protein
MPERHSPCPFCGSLDLDLVREGAIRYVLCTFCGSRGPARSNKTIATREAWRLWDRWTHSDESFRAFNNRIWK